MSAIRFILGIDGGGAKSQAAIADERGRVHGVGAAVWRILIPSAPSAQRSITWRIFGQIVLPLTKPALAATAIFAFLGQWNSLPSPLVFLTSPELFTAPLLLNAIQGCTRPRCPS